MAVKFKDYYEALGIARVATPDEIKAAFRKLARLYHPDVAKNKATAEERFKEINEANEVLSDPEKRRRYDALGADWDNPTGHGATYGSHGGRAAAGAGDPGFEFGGTGFSDFFESFFGSGREGFGAGRSRAAGAARGEDIEADLLITLEEALHGSLRKVTLRRPGIQGNAAGLDTYQVRIKPGVREGQRIRLAGQGYAGHDGGPPGDLYLHARLASHPDFGVHGTDLYFDLELAPWEAVLGVQAKIPTLDGATTLRVPPGTIVGTRLRLSGLGLPGADGARGDLYANVSVQTPSTVSEEERPLWEQLARASAFNPRIKP